jgi:hypothetical protein
MEHDDLPWTVLLRKWWFYVAVGILLVFAGRFELHSHNGNLHFPEGSMVITRVPTWVSQGAIVLGFASAVFGVINGAYTFFKNIGEWRNGRKPKPVAKKKKKR